MTYVTGFLLAVPTANKDRYIKSAEEGWPLSRSTARCRRWKPGARTSRRHPGFKRAVKLEKASRCVLVAHVPDKATADAPGRR